MNSTKRFLFALFALIVSNAVFSQILEPVKWSHEVSKISDTEYELNLIATIDYGWYIYSQENSGEESFAPETYFEFNNQKDNYELIGDTSEPYILTDDQINYYLTINSDDTDAAIDCE